MKTFLLAKRESYVVLYEVDAESLDEAVDRLSRLSPRFVGATDLDDDDMNPRFLDCELTYSNVWKKPVPKHALDNWRP